MNKRLNHNASSETMTAAETYDLKCQEIACLLDFIGMEVAARSEIEPKEIHWGHVGDMTHTRGLLMEILQGVMGCPDDDDIKANIECAIDDCLLQD